MVLGIIRTEYDDASRSVSALLVLRPAQLDHVLRSWMRDVDFAQNRVTIIRQPRVPVSLNDKSVEGTRTECRPWDPGSF